MQKSNTKILDHILIEDFFESIRFMGKNVVIQKLKKSWVSSTGNEREENPSNNGFMETSGSFAIYFIKAGI